jgi:nicotinate dehydrogenase subunit A
MSKTIVVNGKRHRVAATGDTPLLYVLRNELGLKSPKFGCGLGQCGACTVHHGKAAIRSCVMPVEEIGESITTLEGLGTSAAPHPVQTAFIAEQAAQCGYCISGMVMTVASLLQAHPHPSNTEIRQALDNNLCRCGTHMRILRAVQRVVGERE